ncbi:MAG: hypothetical protein D6713_03445 [Deltaproteobacteria bacterium]|nr:MAG: hypothetical protein D6713_03445 [Deltaproteobacteria bacterium]
MEKVEKKEVFSLVVGPCERELSSLSPRAEEGGTGIDLFAVKQAVNGGSLKVVFQSREKERVRDARKLLEEKGIPAAVVSTGEMKEVRFLFPAFSWKEGGKEILFSDRTGKNVSFRKDEKVLVTLTSKDGMFVSRKKAARLLSAAGEEVSAGEVLSHVFIEGGFIGVFSLDEPKGIVVDTNRFDYSFLGEQRSLSRNVNARALFRKIIASFPAPVVDANFGPGALPSIGDGDLKPEKILRTFAYYSVFISRALRNGLLEKSDLPRVKTEGEGGEFYWVGKPGRAGKQRVAGESGEASSTSLSPPPVPPRSFRPRRIFLGLRPGIFDDFKRGWGLEGLPFILRVVLGPLSLVFIFLAYASRSPVLLAAGLASFSVVSFALSFILLKQKREVENVPTAKLRSLPMGLVEVTGRCRRKHFLVSPVSSIPCVYYSYVILERVYRTGKSRVVVREWGDSGPVPFILEDETGRVTVDPKNASIIGGRTQTFSGREKPSISPGGVFLGENVTVKENIIPEGEQLYVLGYASPARSLAEDREKKIRERIKNLKKNADKLKEFDEDGDGQIDSFEWEKARRAVEMEVLLEKDSGESEIVITRPPEGGVFIISDRSERGLVRKLAFRSALTFGLSIASAALAVFLITGIFARGGGP